MSLILFAWLTLAPIVSQAPAVAAAAAATARAKTPPRWVRCTDPKCPDVANKHEHMEPKK